METVIVKTGIWETNNRETKTMEPLNKIKKNLTSAKASNKNGKGGKVGEGGHTGPHKIFSQSIL